MQLSKFAKFAWSVLAYNIAVIVWGTYVRATGSGGGCGAHWPTCDGQIIPRPESVEMLVELSHRGSVGIAFGLAIAMFVWAWQAYPKGHAVRLGAALSLAFFITESIIGAGLVLFKLVEQDASVTRGVSVSAHLVNTFILVACLTYTAWWASGGRRFSWRDSKPLLLGAAAMFLLGASGAIAALGDALFPARSLAEGLAQDVSPTAHIFLQLRIWHPFIAIGTGLLLIGLASVYGLPSRDRTAKQLAIALIGLVVIQWAAGFVNVILLAPVWMQMLHLFLADAVWIAYLLMAAAILGARGVEAVSPGVADRTVAQSAPAMRPVGTGSSEK